jgi:hypothetical protein
MTATSVPQRHDCEVASRQTGLYAGDERTEFFAVCDTCGPVGQPLYSQAAAEAIAVRHFEQGEFQRRGEPTAALPSTRHGLHIDRVDDLGRVRYVGACSCGRWSDESVFRALILKAYARHLVDAQRDPDGKHDAIRGQLRVLRGLLAPSTDGDPRDSA